MTTTDYDNLMGYCRCLVCDRALMPGMEGYDASIVVSSGTKQMDDGSFDDPICTECDGKIEGEAEQADHEAEMQAREDGLTEDGDDLGDAVDHAALPEGGCACGAPECRASAHGSVTSAFDGWKVEVYPGVDLRMAQWIADALGAGVDYIQPADVAAMARTASRLYAHRGGYDWMEEAYEALRIDLAVTTVNGLNLAQCEWLLAQSAVGVPKRFLRAVEERKRRLVAHIKATQGETWAVEVYEGEEWVECVREDLLTYETNLPPARFGLPCTLAVRMKSSARLARAARLSPEPLPLPGARLERGTMNYTISFDGPEDGVMIGADDSMTSVFVPLPEATARAIAAAVDQIDAYRIAEKHGSLPTPIPHPAPSTPYSAEWARERA